jgi:hypothetical protein
MSVVPPPISTIIEPRASAIGSPAPIAAATGSSIRNTRRAPAESPASCTARRSTGVALAGTQIMMRGPVKIPRRLTRRMKCLIISSAALKSAITPSRSGWMVSILLGVRPSIVLASWPTAITWRSPSRWLVTATTEGSSRTIPRPGT